jgi:hypothetical protein
MVRALNYKSFVRWSRYEINYNILRLNVISIFVLYRSSINTSLFLASEVINLPFRPIGSGDSVEVNITASHICSIHFLPYFIFLIAIAFCFYIYFKFLLLSVSTWNSKDLHSYAISPLNAYYNLFHSLSGFLTTCVQF